jgi:hypothetical protein
MPNPSPNSAMLARENRASELDAPVEKANTPVVLENKMRGAGGMSRGGGSPALGDPARIDAFAATAAADNALGDRFYPYYAELCSLSEIRKKPGFGAEFRSGSGGHSVLYLGGVCRDRHAGYPTLKLCDPGMPAADCGVGISVNSHYRNANWVAAEGRDFVFRGLLAPDEPLTRAAYERTQRHATEIGVLDGVEFHEALFRDKPPGMSRRDYMYDISVATDYAVRFGRDVFRARVPLDRARMGVVVDFLNRLNAPYRDGARQYRWRVFNDNCSHVAHNALAAAGVWRPWPTGQFFAIAAFNFPVPKNEFVDLVLRTNDLPVEEPDALYADAVARQLLLEHGALPSAPGALAQAERAIQDNAVYDTAKLRLIFYDYHLRGKYHRRFTRIFSDPRYFDLSANLQYFQMRYAIARQARRAARPNAVDAGRARFDAAYDDAIERAAAEIERRLVAWQAPTGVKAEALA